MHTLQLSTSTQRPNSGKNTSSRQKRCQPLPMTIPCTKESIKPNLRPVRWLSCFDFRRHMHVLYFFLSSALCRSCCRTKGVPRSIHTYTHCLRTSKPFISNVLSAQRDGPHLPQGLPHRQFHRQGHRAEAGGERGRHLLLHAAPQNVLCRLVMCASGIMIACGGRRGVFINVYLESQHAVFVDGALEDQLLYISWEGRLTFEGGEVSGPSIDAPPSLSSIHDNVVAHTHSDDDDGPTYIVDLHHQHRPAQERGQPVNAVGAHRGPGHLPLAPGVVDVALHAVLCYVEGWRDGR